jgi:hypothetical protein
MNIDKATPYELLAAIWTGREGKKQITNTERVQANRALMRMLQANESFGVGELREAGSSWSEIGKILGISRQSAWEKYRFVKVPGHNRHNAPGTVLKHARWSRN